MYQLKRLIASDFHEKSQTRDRVFRLFQISKKLTAIYTLMFDSVLSRPGFRINLDKRHLTASCGKYKFLMVPNRLHMLVNAINFRNLYGGKYYDVYPEA